MVLHGSLNMIGWVIAVAGALVAGALVFAFPTLRRDEEATLDKHRRTKALLAVLTAFLLVADLCLPRAASFWAERPMLAAFVSAGLILGFTALFIDTELQRRREATMRVVLSKPVAKALWPALMGGLSETRAHIDSVLRPWQVAGDHDVQWSQQDGLDPALSTLSRSAREIQDAASEIRTDLLLGGPQMHHLYEACWSMVAAARSAGQVVDAFRGWPRQEYDSWIRLATPTVGDDIARAEWEWNRIGRAYNALAESVSGFDDAAKKALGAELHEKQGFTIVHPRPVEGFPAPTHMYYLGPPVAISEPQAPDQPSG